MSIRSEYSEYLEHFGNTVTLNEFAANVDEPNLLALRHDVDHDMDLAMEMAFWEKEKGFRSTFYLLHTADYWNDPQFIDKALQIQDFGHEIGLHVSVLSEWMRGNLNDAYEELKKILDQLRQSELKISGISTHGDPLCYQKQFINYWCFAELKPDDPVHAESGLSAEGIAAENEKHRILYPMSHCLIREDGRDFPLWSIPMEELGLSYETVHVSYDAYYTDSHGKWHRSQDPLHIDFSHGRHQILIHPEHWRGLQKMYFFLSAARSGSKWLANFLNTATPMYALHEFTLNYRFKEEELVPEKRTSHGFADLVHEKEKARVLLIESRHWIETLKQDFAEANVYLERFLPLVKEIFPEAVLVHLHRDPKDVVRSLMNRNWYDTPEDEKHAKMEVDNWDNLSQFEKVCWYVRLANESLVDFCTHRIVFEEMVQDIEYLSERLLSLGIPVFPRLGAKVFEETVNANVCQEFPEYSGWNDEQMYIYHGIMWPVIMELGYEGVYGGASYGRELGTLLKKYIEKKRMARRKLRGKEQRQNEVETIANIEFREHTPEGFFSVGCKINISENGLVIVPRKDRHAFCVVGGGTWHRLEQNQGWLTQIGSYIRGQLDATCRGKGVFTLFCLMFDDKGEQIGKRSLGQFREIDLELKFSCRPLTQARRFNLAVHMNKNSMPEKVVLKSLCVERFLS